MLSWHEFYAQHGCKHPTREVRKKPYSRAGKTAFIFGMQCLTCGAWTRTASLQGSLIERVPLYDEELERAEQQRLSALFQTLQQRLRAQENAKWWDWYNRYLASPQWRVRRAKVLERAKGGCEGCGDHRATQVHHLTYARVGHEMLFDLVAICDACHQRIHEEHPAVVAQN